MFSMNFPSDNCIFGDHKCDGTEEEPTTASTYCTKHPPVKIYNIPTNSPYPRIKITWQEEGHSYRVNYGGYLTNKYYRIEQDDKRVINYEMINLPPDELPALVRRLINLKAFL